MKKKYLNLSAEIQEYIEFALSDGKLTTKEIDLIKRKAVAYGDDIDELEMVLSKIIAEIDKEAIFKEAESIEITPKYSLLDSFFIGFRKYSNFTGRASRAEFWFFLFFNFIFVFTLTLFIGSRGEDFGKNNNNMILVGLIGFLYPLLTITPLVSLCSRRLHDINMSAWFAIIPIYNIFLFCKAGDIGENIYGSDPYKKIKIKIANNKNKYLDKITNSKIETIGGTMFAIGATCHEAIELKIIDYHQLDYINKWLWIIGGILIVIPKSYTYFFKNK